MARNPYRLADRRQLRARRRVEGWWAGLGGWVLPLAIAGFFPLLRPTLFRTLDGPGAAGHTTDLVMRLGLQLTGVMSLTTYSLLVRGPDRGVIDPHPLLPEPWFDARALRLFVEELPWLVAALLFLVPAARLGVPPLAPTTALVGAWFAGIGVGAGVSLAAPRLALDPTYAVYLDALRGHNPRMQAALIWAPGVSVGIAGGASLLAGMGVEIALHAGSVQPLASVLLAAPFVAGVVGLRAGRRGASTVDKLPALLGEIDAAWAAVEAPEEGRPVAFDWATRWFRGAWRRDLLRELRHLGRTLRIWQNAAFGLAFVLAGAGWARGGDQGAPYLEVAILGCGVIAAAGIRAGATDPEWLEGALGLSRARLVLTRSLALWLCLQPALLAGLVASTIRRGLAGLVEGALAFVFAGAVALAASAAGQRWRGRGWVAYVPVLVAAWAGGASW